VDSKKDFILLLDTSTDVCSLALSTHFNLISSISDETMERKHAALLPLLIDDLLVKSKITLDQVSAVAYSQGPGSYTGLRVGLSSAKAICMAANVPLIAVSTLAGLAHSVQDTSSYDFIVPMIDAGRNEVYHAVYDAHYNEVHSPSPLLLEESSVDVYQKHGSRIIIVGDGSVKAKKILKAAESAFYGTNKMLAQYMIVPATNKFLSSEFENLAYSVPFYLKSPDYKKSTIKI